MKWRDLMNIKETKFEVEKGSILLMSDWYYLPTPPLGQDMTQSQFLSGV